MTDATAVELPPPPPRDAGSALVAAAELLWPSPATVAVQRRRDPVPRGEKLTREYLLIPSAHRPRLMPPAGAPRAAAAIVRRRYGSGGLFGRLAVDAVAALVRLGLADIVGGTRLRMTAPIDADLDDIETALGDVLGTRVLVGLHVGTARVNRKPVLHAVDQAGHTLAFVKVGHTDAARELVRREAATLQRLETQAFTTLQLPRVVDLVTWHGLDLLVLTVVPGRPARASVRNVPYAAMREVANAGDAHTGQIHDSTFVKRLRQLAENLPSDATAERYTEALRRIASHDASLSFGSWHGDWQPFNMSRVRRGQVGVWDWERFTEGVPVGFDALHYVLQVLLHKTAIGEETHRRYLDIANDAAIRAGVAAEHAPVVVAAYVAEVTGRYLSLLGETDGQFLARRAHWSVGLLESAVARM